MKVKLLKYLRLHWEYKFITGHRYGLVLRNKHSGHLDYYYSLDDYICALTRSEWMPGKLIRNRTKRNGLKSFQDNLKTFNELK